MIRKVDKRNVATADIGDCHQDNVFGAIRNDEAGIMTTHGLNSLRPSDAYMRR